MGAHNLKTLPNNDHNFVRPLIQLLSKCYRVDRVPANRAPPQTVRFLPPFILNCWKHTRPYIRFNRTRATHGLKTHTLCINQFWRQPNLTVILPAPGQGRLTRWTTCGSQSEDDHKATSFEYKSQLPESCIHLSNPAITNPPSSLRTWYFGYASVITELYSNFYRTHSSHNVVSMAFSRKQKFLKSPGTTNIV